MLVLQLDGDPEDANDVTVIDGGMAGMAASFHLSRPVCGCWASSEGSSL
jgi:hypothetical protein